MSPRACFFYRDAHAPEPNHRRTLSIIALIERADEVLFERRTDAPLWSLIAGMVRDTETLGDALRREVREETGLVASGYELFGTFSDPTRIVGYPDGNVYRVASFVYSVAVDSFDGMCASPESEELRFFPRSEILELDVPATQRHILERFLSDVPPPHLE